MGCGNSQDSSNTEGPKLKSGKGKQYDEYMGNILPSQLVDGDRQRSKKQIEENDYQNTDDNDQGDNANDNKKRKINKAGNKFRGGEDNDELYEKINKKQKKMKQTDQQLIVQSLQKSSFFYQLSEADIEVIVRSMFYCEVGKGQFVFQQGDQASTYFIIDTGSAEVVVDGTVRKSFAVGSGFGELAFLYNVPRSGSIRCVTDCGFWAIDRRTFRKTVEELVQKELPMNRNFMESVSFFNFMNPAQKDAIAHGLISMKFEAGETLVTEGDRAETFFMIKEGTVSIWKGNQELRKLGPRDSFGEQALYIQSQRLATVKCDTQVKLLSLGRESITRILGDKVQIIVYTNLMRWAFDKCEYLKNLTKIQIERINQNAIISNFKAGDVVYQQNQPLDKISIILEGKIIQQSTQKSVCEKGSLFGETYLLKQNLNSVIEETIVMPVNGVIATIPINIFYKCIGGTSLEEVLEKNKDSHEIKMAAAEQKIDYSHIQLDHLIFIKKLGQGQFGSVYLVQNRDKKDDLYALKGVMKGQIIEQHLEKHLILEKQVLEIINFPFIMTFYRTFKDENSVYFLTKYIKGMELFDVIREMELMSTPDCQFYVGTMILAMEYIHNKSIVYRDLKPENIMVDSEGIMYVIDLGTANLLSKNKHHGRTFTIIGTPHYMAPEIFQGKGYTQAVDLWSIGCCLYEFMCGGLPYGEDCDDPQDIYDEIMKADVNFPQYFKDKKAKKLIEQLLNKVSDLRLGGSYAALKAHIWFDNFDWDKLYNKELTKPFIPPEQKLISDKEIKQKIKEDIPVFNVIKEEQAQLLKKYKKLKPNNPNWDENF